jgi:hypothetical protein
MEVAQAYQWINSTLRADSALMAAATGGIWQDNANVGTSGPVVIFGRQSDTDVLTSNAVRLFSIISMQIKAVGPATNYGTLVTIANRIDVLFKENRNIALSVGGVLASYREQQIAYSELINGQQECHLGGLYTIQLQGA